MKIGFIGAGNMGGALARAVSGSGAEIYIFDRDGEKAQSLADAIGAAVESSEMIASTCDAVFLGVKPTVIGTVIEEILPRLLDRQEKNLLISMAAGVKISDIEAAVGKEWPIIRIMPNTPVQYGAGMVVWSKNESVTDGMAEAFNCAMRGAGRLDFTDESLIDAATAISGCGPAYAFMFAEALARGGIAAGLAPDKALIYAAEMMKGAATTLLNDGRDPATLCDAVCSPGGSTIEGVRVLDNRGFAKAVEDAVSAAYKRCVELGKK